MNHPPTTAQDHPVSAEHSAWLAWSEAYAKRHFHIMDGCRKSMPIEERKALADAACQADENLRELYQKWQDILATDH